MNIEHHVSFNVDSALKVDFSVGDLCFDNQQNKTNNKNPEKKSGLDLDKTTPSL